MHEIRFKNNDCGYDLCLHLKKILSFQNTSIFLGSFQCATTREFESFMFKINYFSELGKINNYLA